MNFARKYVSQRSRRHLQFQLSRHIQIIWIICLVTAEIAASAAVFRIAPLSGICIWYPTLTSYLGEHLIATILLLLVTAFCWAIFGNHAAWEAMCRTREPGRVLFYGALAGEAGDCISSLLIHQYSPRMDAMRMIVQEGSIAPWLVVRFVVWAVAYTAMAVILILIVQPKKSRPAIGDARPPSENRRKH